MSTHQHIYLKQDERTELEQVIKSGVYSARARALLLLDLSQGEARTIKQIIEAVMVSQVTIYSSSEKDFVSIYRYYLSAK